MGKERLRYLLAQYASDQATWQEVKEMLVYIHLPEYEEVLQQYIEAALEASGCEIPVSQKTRDCIWTFIKTNAIRTS
jgi:hypothetical protein